MTRSDVERALDAGKLEMQRPQGDWVPIRRRGRTIRTNHGWTVPVWMEAEVEANITQSDEACGFGFVRIVQG